MADKKITAKIVVDVVTTGAKKALDGVVKTAKKVGSAVGGVLKGFGKLGVITAIGAAIGGAFSKNQKVVDAFNKVINTVAIIFGQIAEAVFGAFEEQSRLNGGFDATKKVLGGLISGVLNVFLGTIQSIKLGVLIAQRAWEDSFFGDGDQDKIKQLTEDINETKEALKQTGEAIVSAGKQIGTNFVEAVQEVADTAIAVVDGVQKAAKNVDLDKAAKQAERLVELQKAAALADAERQKIQLEYQRSAEQLRQLRDDETKSIEDRQKANADLLTLLEEQTAAEEKQIKIKIASAQATYAVTKTNEDLVALKQAELELTDLTERLEGQRSEALSNQNALLKEQVDIARANTDANLALLEEQLKANAELERDSIKKLQLELQNIDIIKQAKLLAIDEELASTAAGTARYAELMNQRAQVEQTAALETGKVKKDLDDEEQARKLANLQAFASISAQGLTAISDLATALAGDDEKKQKKAFELNKKLEIGSTLINTYAAIVAALKTGGPVGIAQAAVVALTGFASIAKIKATTFGSSSGSASGSTPKAVQPINPNAALQGGTAGNNVVTPTEQPIIKTYVVADDVTSAQQANKRVSDRARL